jgi:hypothetical protein
MKFLHFDKEYIPKIAIGATILFLSACIIYFLPAGIPHKITIPVGLLTIASLWLCPWQMTLALLFSAAGDYFGSSGNFLAQMGCFAAAHIWFIIYFALRYHRKVEHDRKLSTRAKGFLTMVLFCTAAILTAAFAIVVPAAPAGILRTGTGIYACLICTMLVLAMLQRSSLFALGAALFVFSDFILAWNMFVVEPVPHSHLMIMIPYYSAQWLLFIRSSSFKLKHPIRLMSF